MTKQIEAFDYSPFVVSCGLTVADTAFLEECAQGIEAGARITVDGIFEIGRALLAARERLGGNDKAFGQWREQRLPWLRSDTALRFMQVSGRFSATALCGSRNLLPTVLYELAAPSTPDWLVSDVLQRAESGERVKVSEVKQLVKKAKAQAKALDSNVVQFPQVAESSAPIPSPDGDLLPAVVSSVPFPNQSREWVSHYGLVNEALRSVYRQYIQTSDLSQSARSFVASMPDFKKSDLSHIHHLADFLVRVIAELGGS